METSDIEMTRQLRDHCRPRRSPKRVTLQVTNLCNSRCVMCQIWSTYADRGARAGAELSSDEWMKVTRGLIRIGVSHIDMTGGEPFLKEGLVELASVVLDELGFTCITTNALQPGVCATQVRAILERSKPDAMLVLSVSIDGLPQTDGAIRGVPDHFDRAISLLAALKEMRTKQPRLLPLVSFTIMDQNCHEMGKLLDLLLAEGLLDAADQFTFRPVQSGPYYRCSNTIQDHARIVREIDELQKRYEFPRNGAFIRGMKESLLTPTKILVPCYALFVSCWVDPYGRVSPCVTMVDRVIGDLRDTEYELLPIWDSPDASELRKVIRSGLCPICWTDCHAHENMQHSGVYL